MVEIFVNLKRFEVPRRLGGICPESDPKKWIKTVIDKTIRLGICTSNKIHLTYLLPESLLITAIERLRQYPGAEKRNLDIGCQSVFRENILPNGNFGAFTANLPAAAAAHIGCAWTMIGHSEERKDKYEMIAEYDPSILSESEDMTRANHVISALLNRAVLRAFESGINVLLCVGETAEERGAGSFDEQKPRIIEVLRSQLEIGLRGTKSYYPSKKIVIGYEPRWAIGPGKTPPGPDYIGFVSSYIKDAVKDLIGCESPVVYGGGLKEENAKEISSINTIDGGLIALTRFTGDIGFEPEGLKAIISEYLA
jgi:triosephosphate isomerase